MNGDSMSDLLARNLENHLRICGERVVVVLPDATLEEVGEAVMIATNGELDRKTIGSICLEETLKVLLAPQSSSTATA